MAADDMTSATNNCVRCACRTLWHNSLTVRLVGLCPLLAVSTTCIKAALLAALLVVTAVVCAITTSLLRQLVTWRLLPLYHGLLAAFGTGAVVSAALVLKAEAIIALSIYPALLAANCYVLSAIQETAETRSPAAALRVALVDGGGIFVGASLFGALRELAAYGALFTDSHLIWGIGAISTRLHGPLPIMASAPGALIALALVIAFVNGVVSRDTRVVSPATDESRLDA